MNQHQAIIDGQRSRDNRVQLAGLTAAPTPVHHEPNAKGAPAPGTRHTVRIVAEDAPCGVMIINESEFNPAIHTLAE